jgi:hypothetical protein
MVARGSDVQNPPPGILTGLLTGFAIAMVACGGIVLQRLTRGDVKTALVGHVLLTITVLAVMCSERVGTSNGLLSPRVAFQVVGGTAGIVVAHCLLRLALRTSCTVRQ